MSAELERSRSLVRARLGREPQDMLEAAVVLEAWAGIPAQRALQTGRRLLPVTPAEPLASRAKTAPPRPRRGVVLEGTAFVATVLAIALWAVPLAADLGSQVVEQGLRVALPLTLTLQWGLRSRYLGRPGGLLALAGHPWELALGAIAIVALPTAALGTPGLLAGLLTVTWTGGTILIRRGWYAVYGVLVAAATPAIFLLPAGQVLAATAILTSGATALAVRPGAAGDPAAPGRWSRACRGALIGAGVGLLIVSDPSVSWTEGTSPALALLPSTVASLWAGHRLWTLEHLIPRAVAGVAVGSTPARGLTRGPLGALLGSVSRLVWLTAALSAALVLTPWLPSGRSGLLAAFGLLALMTLLASLLEALGRASVAVAGVYAALATELLLRWEGSAPFPGAPLALGAAVGVLVLLPPVLALLARPARTLATAMWIT
ncbi:MAG TPA: hypothetical protein VI300_13415 [Solirubrobacter sp.]